MLGCCPYLSRISTSSVGSLLDLLIICHRDSALNIKCFIESLRSFKSHTLTHSFSRIIESCEKLRTPALRKGNKRGSSRQVVNHQQYKSRSLSGWLFYSSQINIKLDHATARWSQTQQQGVQTAVHTRMSAKLSELKQCCREEWATFLHSHDFCQTEKCASSYCC